VNKSKNICTNLSWQSSPQNLSKTNLIQIFRIHSLVSEELVILNIQFISHSENL